MTPGELLLLVGAVVVALLIAGSLIVVAAAWTIVKVRRYRQRTELTHLREARQWWGKR